MQTWKAVREGNEEHLLAQDQISQSGEGLALHVLVINLHNNIIDSNNPSSIRRSPGHNVRHINLSCHGLLLEEDAHARHLCCASISIQLDGSGHTKSEGKHQSTQK